MLLHVFHYFSLIFQSFRYVFHYYIHYLLGGWFAIYMHFLHICSTICMHGTVENATRILEF